MLKKYLDRFDRYMIRRQLARTGKYVLKRQTKKSKYMYMLKKALVIYLILFLLNLRFNYLKLNW